MAIGYNEFVCSFMDRMSAPDREAVDSLLGIIEETGINCEASYYQKIILIKVNKTMVFGISPRKSYLSLYIYNPNVKDKFAPRLGKVINGVGCIKIKDMAEVDTKVLTEMITALMTNPRNIYAKK